MVGWLGALMCKVRVARIFVLTLADIFMFYHLSLGRPMDQAKDTEQQCSFAWDGPCQETNSSPSQNFDSQ